MNVSSLLKNSLMAFFAQSVSMLASVLTTLLLPRLLGVESFGYWQLFVFYSGYVGFFHLGLTDGVYLLFGGTPRDCIDKSAVKSQFLLLMCYEMVFALGLGLVALSLPLEQSRTLVLICTAVLIVVNNAWYYCGYTLQAMNETIRYSTSVLFDRGSFMVVLVLLMVMHVVDFLPYVLCFLVSKSLALAYCLLSFRDILSAGLLPVGRTLRDGAKSLRVGSKLMIANIASGLIIGVVRYGVDLRWGIEVFSKVSFSLSLVNFILLFVQQFALVLFPALRQASSEEVRKVYQGVHHALDLAAPFIYLLYYPMLLLINVWLPDYSESMRFFAVLLPICVFDAKMTLACATYMKVVRREGLLLKINLTSVATSVVAMIIGLYVLDSVEISLVLTVFIVLGRSVYSERVISQMDGLRIDPLLIQVIAMSAVYCAVISRPATTITCILSLIPCVAFIVVNLKKISSLVSRAFSMFKGLATQQSR